MPPSAPESEVANDQWLAVTALVLYLVNLLLLPGLAFVLLLILYFYKRTRVSAFALGHMQQAVVASLWAGVLLVLVNALILLLGGYEQPGTWVVLLLYFTTCHATLVLLGVLALARALAGQPYRFPLLGPKLPHEN